MTREEYEEFYTAWCNSQMSGDAFALIANNYIFNLELKIKMQETIIRDKAAIMEAIAQPKTCDNCYKKPTQKEQFKCEVHGALMHDSVFIDDFYCSEWQAQQ